jgi:hypothetical protein
MNALACITPSSFFVWKPLKPSDVFVLLAVLVALFGERIWRCVDGNRRRTQIRLVIVHFLKNLQSDLLRIRDERNDTQNPEEHIEFSHTSLSEVSHYYHLFQDLILPNLEFLSLSINSKTIDLFDHYRKNIETAKSKGHLTRATVDKLLERIDEAINELS